MKKVTLLLILLTTTLVNVSFSQEVYKRVQLQNPTDAMLHALDDAGIDMTCGALISNQSIQIELSTSELERIEAEGISYSVLVPDLQKFYKERSNRNAPQALAELANEKALSYQQRSLSIENIINNVGQYEGCDEFEWPVPQNWHLNPNLGTGSDDFGGCLTYDMVLQELDDMRTYSINNGLNIISEKLDASLVSGEADIAANKQQSIEGRTIYYVRISDNPDTDEAGEPETLYTSLVHARESATIMNQLFFMWYILENYNTDPAIRNLVNNQALYFIPVFNPDGFVHNENIAPNGGGLQRKNRRITGSCGNTSTSDDYGIDLNRNSNYFYNNGGASSNVCSQTYRGTAAFSEPETQIMRDFFLDHDFEIALNHHSFKNAMLHAYAGTNITNPRPDEYSKYNHDMTFYNRYAHGPSTSISSLNSGNMNDWMLGGSVTDPNGSNGSGKETMAWTPENGSSAEAGSTGSGFWPAPSNFLPIARRGMRMNFLAAYFSGKYGKVHDLNQNDLSSVSGNLSFAIENLGQQASDFTVTVTPISANILSVGPAVTESFSAAQILEQRTINIAYTLNPAIAANDQIEFKVVLTNNYASDNVLYEANITKQYTPSVIFGDNPDTDNLSNWSTSGGSWFTSSDAYSGSTAITSTNSAPYSANASKTIQMNGSLDLTGMSNVLIQYYAKWDLERSFDYVTIEGSTDGSSWAPLCGRLTKPGAPSINNTYSSTSDAGDFTTKSTADLNFQDGISSLYDGDTQDKWAMEEIVIDANNNNFLYNQASVFLRFNFNTDSSNRKDSYANADFEGFSFDDFKVLNILIPCVTDTPSNVSVSDITNTTATVSWDPIPSATYDFRYRETGTSTWTTISDIAASSQALTGLDINTEYEVQVASRCTATLSAFSASETFTTLDPCANGISSFPYTEGFENNTSFQNEWTQGDNTLDDDIDWTRDSGGTPSNNTGPSSGASGSTWYVYTEASTNASPPGSPLKTAIITSTCFDLTDWNNTEINFDYHMFGSGLGSSTENPPATGYIALEVSEDFGNSFTTVTIINDDSQDLWKTAANIDLSAYDDKVIMIRFRGVTGSGFASDMALDNINITADPVLSDPPVANCTDITVQLDAAGNATIVPGDIDNLSTDDEGITNYSIDINSFDCTNLGSNTVTLTVTDIDGQSDSCTSTVTVVDSVDPVAICQDISIQLDGSGNASITAGDINNGSTDNCGIASVVVAPMNFDCTDVGSNIVTLTVTDTSGNTDSCTATVTVQDNMGPTALCQDVTVQLDASGNASITAADINNGSSDNCGIASIVVAPNNFTCADVGANTVTLTVTDTSGNRSSCSATVTVQDNIIPNAVCQDITVQLDASGNASITAGDIDNGSTDNCGIASIVVAPNNFSCADVGPNTVTLTVTDTSGNRDSCTATVTVEDNIAPTAICQNITLPLDASGNATITAADIDNGSTDNCGIASLSLDQTSFTCADLGANTVTLTVTDDNGNTDTCTATVTVQDNIAPTALCQDVTIQLDASGNASISVGDIDNGSTDNCGIASIVVAPTNFSCADVGTNSVSLTVTDTSGNRSTCTATVTVEDNIAPTAVCQDITIQLDSSGNASIIPSNIDNGSTDNCAIASLSLDQTSFDCSNLGANTVTLTVTDTDGNTDTCTATVTVEDNIAPTAICQNITVQLDATGNATIAAADVDNGSTDNCGLTFLSLDQTSFDCSNVGANTVTLTVTDGSGNTDTCSATVTVEDNIDPTAICQNITVQLDPAGNASTLR